VADGKEVKKIGPTKDWIFGLAISRDKKSIATAGYGGHLNLWDLNTGKPAFSRFLKGHITYCLAFTPDGKALVTGGEKDNAAVVTPLTGK
jgi:WD40 repeat protein